MRERATRTRIFAPVWRYQYLDDFAALIDQLHAAIVGKQVLLLQYCDEIGIASTREIEPWWLSFQGDKWTLSACCRLRRDFRKFRPDRIDASESSGERFDEAQERNLATYLRAVGGWISSIWVDRGSNRSCDALP